MKTGLLCFVYAWLLQGVFFGGLCHARGQPSEIPSALPPPPALDKEEVEAFRLKCLHLPVALGPYTCQFRLSHKNKDNKTPNEDQARAPLPTNLICYGTLTASAQEQGYPVVHITLDTAPFGNSPAEFVITAGPTIQAACLRDGHPVPIDPCAPLLQPFLYTAQDLVAGFAYWPHPTYHGGARHKGRPAHVFEYQDANTPWRVRATWDARFFALLKAQWFYENSLTPCREISVLSYQKFPSGVWAVKALACVDHRQHAQTTFELLYFTFDAGGLLVQQ